MALFFLLAFILFNRIGIEAFYAIKQELIGACTTRSSSPRYYSVGRKAFRFTVGAVLSGVAHTAVGWVSICVVSSAWFLFFKVTN